MSTYAKLSFIKISLGCIHLFRLKPMGLQTVFDGEKYTVVLVHLGLEEAHMGTTVPLFQELMGQW